MESELVKANLVILSTGQYKAVVYKSHFPPLRHSVVTETPADTLANEPRLHTETLFVLYALTTTTRVVLVNSSWIL